MAAKPPKGIENKLSVNPLDAELLWHILQGVDGFKRVQHSDWYIWAFGLMGGIDISQSCSLLRDRPVRLQIHVHRASIAQFCHTLQLGYEEVAVTNQTTDADIREVLSMAPNVYYRTRKSVRKIVWNSDKDVWWMQDWLGKRWHADEFAPKRGERLVLVESVDNTFSEVIQLVLSEQAAHFLNATGVQEQLTNWVHHLRRPSLRKSWPSIVDSAENYFWAALQLHREIVHGTDVAFRESYIQFVLLMSSFLQSEVLKREALHFRKSIVQWQRLATLLLDDGSEALTQIPALDWLDFEGVGQVVLDFVEEEAISNVDLRLQVFETTLQKIVELEQQFFQVAVQVLADRARVLCQT